MKKSALKKQNKKLKKELKTAWEQCDYMLSLYHSAENDNIRNMDAVTTVEVEAQVWHDAHASLLARMHASIDALHEELMEEEDNYHVCGDHTDEGIYG